MKCHMIIELFNRAGLFMSIWCQRQRRARKAVHTLHNITDMLHKNCFFLNFLLLLLVYFSCYTLNWLLNAYKNKKSESSTPTPQTVHDMSEPVPISKCVFLSHL